MEYTEDSLSKLKQGMDRFNYEFGRVMMIQSMICAQCLLYKEKRQAVALRIPVEEFEYIAVAVCVDCLEENNHDNRKTLDRVSVNLLDYLSGDHIEGTFV